MNTLLVLDHAADPPGLFAWTRNLQAPFFNPLIRIFAFVVHAGLSLIHLPLFSWAETRYRTASEVGPQTRVRLRPSTYTTGFLTRPGLANGIPDRRAGDHGLVTV